MNTKELDDQIKQLRRARLHFVAILLSVGIVIIGAIFFLQHTGIIGLTMSGIGIIIVMAGALVAYLTTPDWDKQIEELEAYRKHLED